MVNQDRNIFAALLLALGEADAMITGVTRRSASRCAGAPGDRPSRARRRSASTCWSARATRCFIADTTVTERPDRRAARRHRHPHGRRRAPHGHEPRVAFLSYSTFGNPPGTFLDDLRGAVKLLDERGKVDFEYEGEMAPDVALNPRCSGAIYPFSRLTGPANVLIMPGLQSANLSAKLLRELGGDAVIGPMLVGMEAGADRADDGERVGPGDAGGARRRLDRGDQHRIDDIAAMLANGGAAARQGGGEADGKEGE
jgi:malate dehydrogenase (oxaloacetate-decarboxylating)(NADP+)